MSSFRTVSFYTLGCKLNYSESSALARKFEESGYQTVPFDTAADVYVINTCSVTDFADRKCRQVVRRAKRKSPHSKVVVIGCYAQLKPKEIAEIPGVSLVLGAAEKFKLVAYVQELTDESERVQVAAGKVSDANVFTAAYSFGSRTRSFLKVQDGCDYKCTFCTIPLARGKSRSNTVEAIIKDAKEIAKKGAKEIVLTGVNIGDFGNGTAVIEGTKSKKEALFIDLIKALDAQVTDIDRLRISSIEPNLCTDDIIGFVAASRRFVPHFHMPLQSGNNKQLKQMRRRYKRELYADRVKLIKELMPHACIGVDVIVGFPGETEEGFLETCRFIDGLNIAYLHVFTYSERANTLAVEMNDPVPMRERKRRNEVLRQLSDKKKRHFYLQHLGDTRPVLFEPGNAPNTMSGFTDNYIKVEVPLQPKLLNSISMVNLDSYDEENGVVMASLAHVVAKSLSSTL